MLFTLLSLFLFQAATDLSGTKHGDPLPPEIAASVSAKLAPGGVRAGVGANTLTFWWVKELPFKSPAWREMPEVTLVVAVKIEKAFPYIRGRGVKPDTY